jgi:hypothetical protein
MQNYSIISDLNKDYIKKCFQNQLRLINLEALFLCLKNIAKSDFDKG